MGETKQGDEFISKVKESFKEGHTVDVSGWPRFVVAPWMEPDIEPDIGTCTGCGADATGAAPLLCADCRSAASR